jgi:signal transduction histidine kinase
VKRPAALQFALPRGLTARVAALPQRRQELIGDAGLALALAAVNVVALLPYGHQFHPLWLALVLVSAEAIPLAWRGAHPVRAAFVIGAARVAYDRLQFGFAPFPLGPAIAFYTVIDRCGPAWRRITCLLVVTGGTLSQLTPGHSEPYDAIFQAFIFGTAWAAGVLSRTKRASLRAAENRADRAEAELDQQAARAAAAERTRIARELHDVVAHHVSLMAVQAEAASSLLPARPDDARRSVDIISATARQALTELRRLLGVLRGPAERPETAPSATLADLGTVLDQVREAGLPVDLDVVGAPYPLAPSIDLTAYRIVQEALTNTLRHTAATRARVTLSYEPGYLAIGVTDRGPRRAIPWPASNGRAAGHPGGHQGRAGPGLAGSGFGLAGIAERVASCGGSLTVGPTAEDGFAVTARLPAA